MTADPVADLIRRSRAERGLPDQITEPDVLRRVAALARAASGGDAK